jgi:hypothetical protein
MLVCAFATLAANSTTAIVPTAKQRENLRFETGVVFMEGSPCVNGCIAPEGGRSALVDDKKQKPVEVQSFSHHSLVVKMQEIAQRSQRDLVGTSV